MDERIGRKEGLRSSQIQRKWNACSRSLTIIHETAVNWLQVAFHRASNYDETGWRRAWHVKCREIFGRNYFCPHIQALQIGDDSMLVSVRSPQCWKYRHLCRWPNY